MRESYFQGEWIDSWRHHFSGCHIQKLPDAVKSAKSRFIPAKPYDIYALFQGRFYAMELKLKTKLGGFSFEGVTEWQINNLLEAKENGALSYVVINYRVNKISPRQQKTNGITDKRINKAFLIDITSFMTLDKTSSSKSIPFRSFIECKNLFLQVEKVGDFWDVSKIMKEVNDV